MIFLLKMIILDIFDILHKNNNQIERIIDDCYKIILPTKPVHYYEKFNPLLIDKKRRRIIMLFFKTKFCKFLIGISIFHINKKNLVAYAGVPF